VLEGVERLIDLGGPHAAGTIGEVTEAIRAGDAAALAEADAHFAGVARDGQTVRLARTIGVPLRYFVAKMYHGPFLVVSDRIDRIFDWCREQRIAWQFDPAYTRMVPAHHLVEVDQVGCPDPAPRYARFFTPAIGGGPADLDAIGAAYVGAAYAAVERWLDTVPAGEPVALAFSGGVDSTSVLLLARRALERLGRDPDLIRPFTLDTGGGTDALQAESVVRELGIEQTWERVAMPPAAVDLERAIRVIEDYHPLDVECAASGLCLLDGIRARHPALAYLLDGDGGDENLKSYPLEDSDLTLSSVLANPLLYHEGWGVDALKHSPVYSGGLSRSYMRTHAPAHATGFTAFSPYTVRSVIAEAVAIPFERLLAGDEARLATLKQDVVSRGVETVTGVRMPVHPKRRFQDGASSAPRARVSKAWCRRTFDRIWQERLARADDLERRSGNEMALA
jgi:asparagine synthase (glutamine-hydrolysing)